MARTGIEVLSHGLPELPDQLSYLMAIPVAYWAAQHCAVVLFRRFRPRGRKHDPDTTTVTYARTDTGWTTHNDRLGRPGRSIGWGIGSGHDPIARPGRPRELGRAAMVVSGGSRAMTVTPGYPAIIRHGYAAPAVKYLALIQDGREDVCRLESHFGAWVICTEQCSPFQVEGRDADGTVLARFHDDPDD
jgi:hypothetical protein